MAGKGAQFFAGLMSEVKKGDLLLLLLLLLPAQ
jgi:hypothetical protein